MNMNMDSEEFVRPPRPLPFEEVIPPLNMDGKIEITHVPEEQPFEALGVYYIVDQYNNEHLVINVGGVWEAHHPDVLGAVVSTCHCVFKQGLVASYQDAYEIMSGLIEDTLSSPEARDYFGARIKDLIEGNRREEVLRGTPEYSEAVVGISVASEIVSKTVAELRLSPNPN